MSDIFTLLKDADDKKAYAIFKEIKAESEVSDTHYKDFEGFLNLINHSSSFVRTRGFALCCAQAKWDSEGKLERHLPELMKMLSDDKPTAVRQCIKALYEVVEYKGELSEKIKAGLEGIEIDKYNDSMMPLIKKDIENFMKKAGK